MKNDKFLIGIVTGIIILVIAAVVIVLTRSRAETYRPDDTPDGVAHNYFLAIQREDYEKAYGYLSDELKAKPTLDDFIVEVNNYGNRQEAALTLGEASVTGDRAQVRLSITNHSGGGVFDSGSYTNDDTAYLRANAAGEWKLYQFPYPYWGYSWNEEKD